jgi:dephospho-CoA kinase
MQFAGFPKLQRRIGLTGGIATGKTTVADYLANHLPILDADRYAHEAVAPGSQVLAQIADRYGPQILLPVDIDHPGSAPLDRRRLGDVVFANPAERQWLEQQIHPIVAQRFDQALADLAEAPVVLLVIPLLFEAQLTHQISEIWSEIWVVTCPPQAQLDRLIARNHWTQAQAEARIAAQMPLAEKCALADVVLTNSGDRASLLEQVDRALG